MPTKLTPEIINAAILGFEEQKKRIDTALAELRAMLSGGPAKPTAKPAATSEQTKPKRRKMSAAGRKAISEATKKRWAAVHAAKEAVTTEPTAPQEAKPEKVASKKAVVKAPSTRAAKKSAAKKTAPATAQAEIEAESQ
jgi:hypothetical protein